MKKTLFQSLIYFSLSLFACCGTSNSTLSETPDLSYTTQSISIQSATQTSTITAEIADTEEKQDYGLMNRSSLDENSGMLFVFDTDETHSFWMKDTLISLDMIFINAAKNIVFIEENATPLSETPIVPTEACRYVLEVNGGFVASHGVSVGDTVTF